MIEIEQVKPWWLSDGFMIEVKMLDPIRSGSITWSGRCRAQLVDATDGPVKRDTGHRPAVNSVFLVGVYLLHRETRSQQATEAHIESARASMAEATELARAFLVDGDLTRNEPLPMEAFPQTEDVATCRRCDWRRLCSRG